jgi:WW domain/Ankyrin repeats (3 copies)
MFAWATEKLDKLSQTVAPPPTDAVGRYLYAVQRLDEDTALGCIAELDPIYTVVTASKGTYPIHVACQYSLLRLIRLIMNQPGASIQQVDANGETPLHYVCRSTQGNALEVVKILLMDYGADVCAKNAQGKYPYDVATLNSIRQHLLPLQLQKETQACLDNGGQGLPPGIDLGGLKIQNPAMPPPPTFGGGPAGAGGPPMAVSSFSMSAAGTSPYAPPPMPNDNLANSSSVPPSPQTFPSIAAVSAPVPASSLPVPPAPRSYGGRSSSNNRSTDDLSTDPTTGYARTGGSSLAVYSKYKADGFHSSSSDVNLQKKYGHVGSAGIGVVPPPPSSGNSISSGGLHSTPPPFQGGGVNPFSRSSSGMSSSSIGGSRYVAYGPAATAPSASGAGPSPAYGQMQSPSNLNAPASQYFTPTVSSPVASQAPAAAAAAPAVSPTYPGSGGPYGGIATPGVSNTQVSTSAATLFDTPQPVIASSQLAADVATTDNSSNDVGNIPEEKSSEEQANFDTSEDENNIGDWIETTDPSSGKSYYYNPTTNETSWVKPMPESRSDSGVSADEEDEWEEIQDPSTGKPYYFNATTNETRWEKPDCMKAEETDSGNSFHEDEEEDDDDEEEAAAEASEESDQEPFTSNSDAGTSSDGSSAVETDASDDKVEETDEEPMKEHESTDDDNDLPDGWVETQDPSSGRIYYFNSLTQETSWERPMELEDDSGPADAAVVDDNGNDNGEQSPESSSEDVADGWSEVTDPNTGKIYYYNQLTQETSWEKPSKKPTNGEFDGSWSEVTDPNSGKTYYYNSSTNETSWTKPDSGTTKEDVPLSSPTEFASIDMAPESTSSESVDAGTNIAEESTLEIAKRNIIPVPQQTASAEDLFSAGPPSGVTEPVNSTGTDSTMSPTAQVKHDVKPSSGKEVANGKGIATAAAMFSSSLEEPGQSTPDLSSSEDVAVNDKQDENHMQHEEEEDMMEEVPLSPDAVTKTMPSSAAPSNDLKISEPSSSVQAVPQLQSDLFAAIGMPPPPVRSKRL